jgi:NADH-quinone oxidoreductase subunit G
MLDAAAAGRLGALVVGGVDPHDLADPVAALAALRRVGFLVSLELQHSAVTELADVVLPVAPDAQRAGSYRNWEGRLREFGPALDASGVLPDCRVLDTLAVEMDVDIFTQTPAAAAGELGRLGAVAQSTPSPRVPASEPMRPDYGQAVLATWRQLIDDGSLTIDEPALAGTARPALVRCNAATAERLGLVEGEPATVRTEQGAITLPLALADLPDGVVWLPGNSPGSRVRTELGVGHGELVGVSR